MIPVPMPAGGMIALNGLVLHAAGINQTDGTRMAMTLGFHSYDEFTEPGESAKRVIVRGKREYGGNDKNVDMRLM